MKPYALAVVMAASLVAAACDGTSAQQSSLKTRGSSLRISKAYFGCPVVDDMERIVELARQNDPPAQLDYGLKHSCQWLNEGDVVRVEDNSIIHMMICVRAPGHGECVWFPPVLTEDAG